MLDDDVRRRLERFLDRPRAGGSRPPSSAKSSTKQRISVRRATLEEAVPNGYAVRVTDRGTAYKILTPIQEVKGGEAIQNAFVSALRSPHSPAQHHISASCKMTAALDDVLFFDLETTGLGQTPLFLIGTMTWEHDNLMVRQFLARDFGEEAAVIQLFLDLASEKQLLISFNGKSFDLPFVYQRAEMVHVPCVLHAHHFDLLHASRRIWRSTLPNCQLQTLEQLICQRPPRVDDIPGEDIPAAYQTFLRNGNALQIAQIMRHNVLDLVTMADLITRFPADIRTNSTEE